MKRKIQGLRQIAWPRNDGFFICMSHDHQFALGHGVGNAMPLPENRAVIIWKYDLASMLNYSPVEVASMLN